MKDKNDWIFSDYPKKKIQLQAQPAIYVQLLRSGLHRRGAQPYYIHQKAVEKLVADHRPLLTLNIAGDGEKEAWGWVRWNSEHEAWQVCPPPVGQTRVKVLL